MVDFPLISKPMDLIVPVPELMLLLHYLTKCFFKCQGQGKSSVMFIEALLSFTTFRS